MSIGIRVGWSLSWTEMIEPTPRCRSGDPPSRCAGLGAETTSLGTEVCSFGANHSISSSANG